MVHKELKSWQKAMEVAVATYLYSKGLPKDERYGLVSQMQRSSVSIASNIAEGAGRNSTKEYLRFVHLAQGSLNELETQYILCKRLGYPEPGTKVMDQLDHLGRLISLQIKSLKTKLSP